MKNTTKKNKTKKNKKKIEPHVPILQSIRNILGNDERIIMFRKVKGKLFLFVINSKSFEKINLKEAPKTYRMEEFENLGAFLYKLSRQ